MKELSVLIVEDKVYSADLKIRLLKKFGFNIRYAILSEETLMQNVLKAENWDLIMCSNMPSLPILKTIEIRNQVNREIPLVVFSDDINKKDVTDAFDYGCTSYIEMENFINLKDILNTF